MVSDVDVEEKTWRESRSDESSLLKVLDCWILLELLVRRSLIVAGVLHSQDVTGIIHISLGVTSVSPKCSTSRLDRLACSELGQPLGGTLGTFSGSTAGVMAWLGKNIC